MHCLWCSNPESQAAHPELAYFSDKCIACERCVERCPYDAISVQFGAMRTERTICAAHCYHANSAQPFPCLGRCFSGARKEIGSLLGVDAVMKEVLKDRLIYEQSGGGLTLTGGEPMVQPRFARSLLEAAKHEWLHTAMETCGYAQWSDYQSVLELVDFVFLDIKLMDDVRHRHVTGRSNELILRNAPQIDEFMRRKQGKVVVRTPVIPGITDIAAVSDIADFVQREMPGVATYELMPYHRLGRGKYTDIGRAYEMNDVEPVRPAQMEPLYDCVLSRGFSLKWQ